MSTRKREYRRAYRYGDTNLSYDEEHGAEPIPLCSYLLLVFIMVIYGIGFVVYSLQILNLSILHTYQYPAGAPGMLTSMRYGARWTFSLFLSFRIVFICVIGVMLMWRSNMCCLGIWVVFAILLWVAGVLGFMFLARDYATANGTGQAFNYASDPLYCCLPENFNNPINLCQNSLPCPTVPTLEINPDFLTLFWSTLAYNIADIVVFAIILYAVLREPKLKKQLQEIADIDSVLQIAENTARRGWSALRKRVNIDIVGARSPASPSRQPAPILPVVSAPPPQADPSATTISMHGTTVARKRRTRRRRRNVNQATGTNESSAHSSYDYSSESSEVATQVTPPQSEPVFATVPEAKQTPIVSEKKSIGFIKRPARRDRKNGGKKGE